MGKFNAQVKPWLKLGFTSKWIRSDYDRPTALNGGFYDNVLRRGWPTVPVRDPNGYYVSRVNYIEQLENGGRYKEQNDIFANQVTVTINPLKGWNIIGEFNSRINSDWRHTENFTTYGHDADDSEKPISPWTLPALKTSVCLNGHTDPCISMPMSTQTIPSILRSITT